MCHVGGLREGQKRSGASEVDSHSARSDDFALLAAPRRPSRTAELARIQDSIILVSISRCRDTITNRSTATNVLITAFLASCDYDPSRPECGQQHAAEGQHDIA